MFMAKCMICHQDDPKLQANYICYDCYCELDLKYYVEDTKKNSEEE